MSDLYYNQVVLLIHGDGEDNGTVITDQKGTGLTRSGDTCTKTAVKKFGTSSIFFDGNSDYFASTAASYSFDFSGGNWTIECWVRFSSASGTPYVLQLGNSISDRISLYRDASGYLRVYTRNSGTAGDRITGSTPLSTDTWYHVALTKSAGDLKLFLDGAQEGSTASWNSSWLASNAKYVVVGNQNWSGTYPDECLHGYIDDLRLTKGFARYTGAFTTPEAAAPDEQDYTSDPFYADTSLLLHMDGDDNGTTFTDAKGHSFSAVANACTKTSVKKFGSASAFYDGNGDSVTASANSDWDFGTEDFTIEVWAYPSSTSSVKTLLDSRNSAEDSGVTLYTNGGQPAFTTANTQRVVAGQTLPLNTWTHVALVRSNSALRMYTGGVASSHAYYSNAIGCPGSLRIGGHLNTATLIWSGYLDEFRITKGVARYQTAFTPPTAAFPEGSTVEPDDASLSFAIDEVECQVTRDLTATDADISQEWDTSSWFYNLLTQDAAIENNFGILEIQLTPVQVMFPYAMTTVLVWSVVEISQTVRYLLPDTYFVNSHVTEVAVNATRFLTSNTLHVLNVCTTVEVSPWIELSPDASSVQWEIDDSQVQVFLTPTSWGIQNTNQVRAITRTQSLTAHSWTQTQQYLAVEMGGLMWPANYYLGKLWVSVPVEIDSEVQILVAPVKFSVISGALPQRVSLNLNLVLGPGGSLSAPVEFVIRDRQEGKVTAAVQFNKYEVAGIILPIRFIVAAFGQLMAGVEFEVEGVWRYTLKARTRFEVYEALSGASGRIKATVRFCIYSTNHLFFT